MFIFIVRQQAVMSYNVISNHLHSKHTCANFAAIEHAQVPIHLNSTITHQALLVRLILVVITADAIVDLTISSQNTHKIFMIY